MPDTQGIGGAVVPGHPDGPSPVRAPVRRAATFDRAQAYIASRLCDADLSVEQICEVVEVPRTTLYRLFLDHGGIRSYIKNQRMLGASAMLFDSDRYRTVTELAKMWQFADTSHFVRAFKKHYGWPPHRYRMMNPADRTNGGGSTS